MPKKEMGLQLGAGGKGGKKPTITGGAKLMESEKHKTGTPPQ